MNSTEKQILELLEQNSRHSNKDIADMLNIAESDVEKNPDNGRSGIIRRLQQLLMIT